MACRPLWTQGISKLFDDIPSDPVPDLPVSNAKSLSNLLAGELSSSDEDPIIKWTK